MTVDCQWIEKNLESLFCERLSKEEEQRAREHIASCAHCREEVAALNAIDPLIRKHFQHQLAAARAPKHVRLSFVYGGAAAALVFVLMLAILSRTPQPNTEVPLVVSRQPQPVATAEPPSTAKTETNAAVSRTKPQPAAAPAVTSSTGVTAVADNAPEFLVTDPAGYSRSLEYYRGHVLLIGVWSTDRPSSSASLERLYKTFGSNTKLRLIGVTNERQAKAPNTTFPVVYNQGSKLFGAEPGEFVLLDATGEVQLRGSLVRDFDAVAKALEGQ